MSAGVDGSYFVVLAEELTLAKEPTTAQEVFPFGRVLSMGHLVQDHLTLDTIVAQPDSLRLR